MRVYKAVVVSVLVICATGLLPASEKTSPEFMSLDVAKAVLEKYGAEQGSPGRTFTPEEWRQWLEKSDARVRARLEVGEEDSLTNLLRFGVTFTKEYRIDDEYLVLYG